MQTSIANDPATTPRDASIGRIVSVTGSKAIVLLDNRQDGRVRSINERPEMGTLLAIDTANTIVLSIVSALSVPVPAQREGEGEVWIAELGLVGELWKAAENRGVTFNRGVTVYPALGDRVRVASKVELELAFCGDMARSVRVGCIRQDASIPAMVRVDDLLGKHFAILGTTGTGKSCTTALILRAILQKNPAAHIVLLDPHNEYATAFSEFAEVMNPRNMQLPFWLLNFEEIVEVLVGDQNRKAEIEILQELIPIAKSRYSAGRTHESNKLRRGVIDSGRFTVDTPVPYHISDLTGIIDERMGKLENKKDLAPYRNLKNRIDSISQDARYAFMFGSLTVYDGMTQVLGRLFRVPVNNRPLTILELTGIPTEVVNVVVSVLCRLTFDFAVWSEGQIPVTIVCEEAHRYVPVNPSLGFEPCKRAIAKIAKEGRKYGASLCIVTQRPAEIDPTILSQCNTVFALRMTNDKDQHLVQSAVADTGSGLLEFLPSLGQREAIAFGDGMALPVRIRFDELPKNVLPRSSTARFTERWRKSVGDEGFLDQVVERWRASGVGMTADASQQASMMVEALGIGGDPADDLADLANGTELDADLDGHPPALRVRGEADMFRAGAVQGNGQGYGPATGSGTGAYAAPLPPQQNSSPISGRLGPQLRKDAPQQPAQSAPGSGSAARSMLRRETATAGLSSPPAAPHTSEQQIAGGVRSLRDRLLQRPQGR